MKMINNLTQLIRLNNIEPVLEINYRSSSVKFKFR
jgi:hypothetical protein